MNWLQLIERRNSVRQFDSAIDDATVAQIKNICQHVEPLNSSSLELRLLPGSQVHNLIRGYLGKYGRIISPWYVAVIAPGDTESLINAGYCGQRTVIEMTALDLGTCWIGGLFNSKAVDNYVGVDKGHGVRALIAWGRSQKATWSKTIKVAGRLGKRIPPEKMSVFDSSGDSCRPWRAVLEAVRWAPSALNRQPWRLWFSGDVVHLYSEGKSCRRKFTPLEMGIALCHLELACKQLGIPGKIMQVPHPTRRGWLYWTSFSVGQENQ